MNRHAFVRLMVLAAAVSMVVPAVSPAGTSLKTRTVKREYVGSLDPFSTGLCKTSRIPTNVGKVCVPLKRADRKVAISIADEALGRPGFFYMFVDKDGRCVGDTGSAADPCPSTGSACGSAKGILKPSGAVMLEIFPSGAVIGPLNCAVLEQSDSPGVASAGTITTKIIYLVKK